jgi:hypothetical protein
MEINASEVERILGELYGVTYHFKVLLRFFFKVDIESPENCDFTKLRTFLCWLVLLLNKKNKFKIHFEF